MPPGRHLPGFRALMRWLAVPSMPLRWPIVSLPAHRPSQQQPTVSNTRARAVDVRKITRLCAANNRTVERDGDSDGPAPARDEDARAHAARQAHADGHAAAGCGLREADSDGAAHVGQRGAPLAHAPRLRPNIERRKAGTMLHIALVNLLNDSEGTHDIAAHRLRLVLPSLLWWHHLREI